MQSREKEIQWQWYHPDVQDLLLKYYRDWLFCTPEIAHQVAGRVLSLTGVEPPGEILDIGCGLGFHAAAFANQGFRVLAFDPGDRYVAIARDNTAYAGERTDIRQMQCCDLNETDRFALAWAGSYCPGQLSSDEVVRDFRKIHAALMPGGWFVSSVAGKPKIAPMDRVRNWQELSDCFLLSEKWADDHRFHEHCWFVYPDRNEIIKLVEVERMYGVDEILPLIKEAGFTQIIVSGSLKEPDSPAEPGRHFAFRCRKQA